jgi:hypothetical protein
MLATNCKLHEALCTVECVVQGPCVAELYIMPAGLLGYYTVLKLMDEEPSTSLRGGGILLLRWGPHVQVEETGVAMDFSFLPSLELGDSANVWYTLNRHSAGAERNIDSRFEYEFCRASGPVFGSSRVAPVRA